MAKRSSKMTPNCQCCKGWHDDARGRVSICRFGDGVTHAAPEMWIASRAYRLEREYGYEPLVAWEWAWRHWAFNCGVQLEAEKAVA